MHRKALREWRKHEAVAAAAVAVCDKTFIFVSERCVFSVPAPAAEYVCLRSSRPGFRIKHATLLEGAWETWSMMLAVMLSVQQQYPKKVLQFAFCNGTKARVRYVCVCVNSEVSRSERKRVSSRSRQYLDKCEHTILWQHIHIHTLHILPRCVYHPKWP